MKMRRRNAIGFLAAAAAVGAFLSLGIALPAGWGAPVTPPPQQPARADDHPITSLRDLNAAFVNIARAVNPTVVTVFTEKVLRTESPFPFFVDPFEEFFGRPRRGHPQPREYRQQGLGSGVIVSSDGYILTNNHVVDGADTINIRLIDDKTLPATVVGTDPKTDVAVLKVDAENLPAIKIGDSDKLQVGELVLAVGSPLSPQLAHTVTSGIVSAKGRSNVGLAEYEDFIQTDAAINPGNSGGALINIDGELVGINTAIASRSGGYQGIGFAVPINMARRVMEQIIEHGAVVRGWLGVYIQDVNETMAKGLDLSVDAGALVADIVPDGPAESAGLKRGDVIVELDGKPVKSTTQLRNTIASRSPGSKVTLRVLRDGKYKRIRVTLDKLPAEQIARDVGETFERTLGISIAPLDPSLAAKYGVDSSRHGVAITAVRPGSPAGRTGLREGDVIAEVNRRSVENIDDLSDIVRGLGKGDTVALRIIRRNRSFYVAFKL